MGLFAYHILWSTANLPDGWAWKTNAILWDYTYSDTFQTSRRLFLQMGDN